MRLTKNYTFPRHDPDRQNRDRDHDPDLHQKFRSGSRSRSQFETPSAIRSRSQPHDRAIFWAIFLSIDLWYHLGNDGKKVVMYEIALLFLIKQALTLSFVILKT